METVLKSVKDQHDQFVQELSRQQLERVVYNVIGLQYYLLTDIAGKPVRAVLTTADMKLVRSLLTMLERMYEQPSATLLCKELEARGMYAAESPVRTIALNVVI